MKRLFPLALGLAVMAWVLATLELDWAALFRGDINAGTEALRLAAERQGGHKDVAMALMVALLPLVLVPVSLTMLATAILLPPAKAVVAMLIGTAVNTALAYGVGRLWGRRALDWMGMDRFRLVLALEAGARDHSFKMAVFSRCFPIPFSVVGIAAAVVGVKLRHMLAGTLIIMLPTSLIYIFFTEALRSGDAKFLGPTLLIVALMSLAAWYVKRSLQGGIAMPQGLLAPQRPALGPQLTLYTLPGHEACQDARRELWQLRTRLKFEVQEIDLASDERLRVMYQDMAPVVFLGERRLFSFQVDENALENYLRAERD